MGRWLDYRDRCVVCGRFVRQLGPGVSWCQTWQYDMGGTPCLNDPTYRCSPCTDRLGIEPTNCAPGGNYNGRNPVQPDTPSAPAQPSEGSEPHGSTRGPQPPSLPRSC